MYSQRSSSLNPLPKFDSSCTDREIRDTNFDTQQLRLDFLTSNVLKSIEPHKLNDKVFDAFKSNEVSEMIRQGYIIILLIKFYPDKQSLRQEVRLQLNEHYVKLFAQLPSPKEQIINIVIFSCCYMIHQHFYLQHPQLRDHFDSRFIYDVYHIMIHSFNGIFESDYYIKLHIDKYFKKFLSYRREKHEFTKKILKRQEKNFLGQALSFPDLNAMDGGNDFSKTLRDCLKPRKKTLNRTNEKDIANTFKEESVYISPDSTFQQTKEQMFGRLKFNMNSVSPSIGKILHLDNNQLKGEKSRMVQHKMEKLNDNDVEVWQMLKNVGQTATSSRKKEPKGSKDTKNNLIETYQLSMPVKEYFQKHPKVDPLFKNMLELKFVLNELPESLQQLPSSHEVRNYINDYYITKANVGLAAKTSTARQRIIQHLRRFQHQEDDLPQLPTKKNFFGFEGTESVQASTALGNGTHHEANTFFNNKHVLQQSISNVYVSPQARGMAKTLHGGFGAISTPVLVKQPIEATSRTHVQEQRSAQYEKKLERTFKLVNSAEDGKLFVYKEKGQFYNQQFEKMMNGVSTESKINDLMLNIQMRQNLVNKSLMKKIHKM